MKKIYKYELNIAGDMTIIDAPIDQLLKIDWQNGTGAVLWAIIDDEWEPTTWRIMSLGTGWTVPDGMNDYIGTVQDEFGYVWHYFLLHNDCCLQDDVKELKQACHNLQDETFAALAQVFGKAGTTAEEAANVFSEIWK